MSQNSVLTIGHPPISEFLFLSKFKTVVIEVRKPEYFTKIKKVFSKELYRFPF